MSYKFASNERGLGKLTLVLFLFLGIVIGGFGYIHFKVRKQGFSDLLSYAGIKKFFTPEMKKGLETVDPQGKLDRYLGPSGSGGTADNLPTGIIETKAIGGKSDYARVVSGDASPVASGPAEPAERVRNTALDEIVFRNGDVLTGTVTTPKVIIRTESGNVTFNVADVYSAAIIYEAEKPYDRVTSRNGDRATGRLVTESITLSTPGGDTLNVPFSRVKMINMREKK